MASTTPNIDDIKRASLTFDETKWATGSVLDDPFYSVDPSTGSAPPGTLLKLEATTDEKLFALSPYTALSRIVYQSKTLTGSLVPVSAYILWPHGPRSSSDGYQVVAWAHGTCGTTPNCAPSHLKNLYHHYSAPYQLALQGYVVVATDYAGLGVSKTASGEPIVHEYLSSPAGANDVFYSVKAAQEALPSLSKSFVVFGHSQGGGVAWAAAQRQAIEPVEGHLGTIAFAPVTTLLDISEPAASFLLVSFVRSIESAFPEFDRSEVLTPEGMEKFNLMEKVGGFTPNMLGLLFGVQLTKPNWIEHPIIQKFQATVSCGGKKISGPFMVIHGLADADLFTKLIPAAVEKTMKEFPETGIEHVRVPGVIHGGATCSAQWIWMDWIAKRFADIPQEAGLKSWETKAAMPITSYKSVLNWQLALNSET